jgi:FkbM family methyltransferase
MKEMGINEGKTVLFVSHNIGAVENLCSKGILLRNGELALTDKTSAVLNEYLKEITNKSVSVSDAINRNGKGEIMYTDLKFFDEWGGELKSLKSGKKTIIRLIYKAKTNKEFRYCRISLAIKKGISPLVVLSSELTNRNNITLKSQGEIDFIIDKFPFSQGHYDVTLFLESDGKVQDWVTLNESQRLGIDLYKLSLNQIGILNFETQTVSGEKHFVENFLKDRFKDSDPRNLTFFDVGANIGKYTKLLYSTFPESAIFSFEPNEHSYSIINKEIKTPLPNNIQLHPIGLSSRDELLNLISYENNASSSHASLSAEIFTDLYKSTDNIYIQSKFVTLDNFCCEHNINKIDFLKIDTEGHELEVLKGAVNMLKENKINIIQFEFGECHVYKRVFLKDFYKILQGFMFYRLLPNSLLPLGEYSSTNEIFKFQNIIAIRDSEVA